MEQIWQWISNIASLIGVFSAFLAAWNVIRMRKDIKKEKTRLTKKIRIVLKEKDSLRQIIVPTQILRAELSRAEILGVLGMMHSKLITDPETGTKSKPRFAISFFNTDEFIQRLRSAKLGKDDMDLIVDCTAGELDMFEIKP